MNRERITRAVETPTKETIDALLDDYETVFWVSRKDSVNRIVKNCESVLRTGYLAEEIEEDDSEDDFEIYIHFGGRRVKVSLEGEGEVCYIALCALNEALWPDFEVRFCIDSGGGDTLGFLPLMVTDWRILERQYREALQKRFYPLALTPNLFTDTLP